MTASTLPQLVTCPYCGEPVSGLLAGCENPDTDCRRRELDDDRAHERLLDR